MNDTHDEISLRELYLILRRGLPLILVTMVIAGLGTMLYLGLRGDRYQAETTVHINPTPVRVQGTRELTIEQRNDISWETYQTIARSRAVLEASMSRLEGLDISASELSGNGSLTRLVGPQNPTQVAPLTISHAVVHEDPEVAAAAADAWAAATVETVQASQLASIESVREATMEQLRGLEAELAVLEEEWRQFQSRDETALIDAQLLALGTRIPTTAGVLEDSERLLAAAQASSQVLAALQDPGNASGAGQPSAADQEAAVALLEGREQLTADTIAALTALVAQGGEEADLVALMRQVELQRLAAEQAGFEAQVETSREQLDRMQAQATELRERRAQLVLERDRLQRRLDSMRSAHENLAELQPVIEYIYGLAPTNSRILSEASVPTGPVGPRRLLVAILAGLAAGMVALLYVFVRAAVSEPATAVGRERRPASPDA